MANEKPQLAAYNYCVSFIDLLGQRAALEGQGLLPRKSSVEDSKRFRKVLADTVLSIESLQATAMNIAEGMKPKKDSVMRASLSEEERKVWDQMHQYDMRTQHWSDGLMSFVNLGNTEVMCHMNGIYHLITTAGLLCYLGLGAGRPVRGAIDIAWGVELKPGELYGAAVARAYELESEVARLPRIVVGKLAMDFLAVHGMNEGDDLASRFNREMANHCLTLLVKAPDGNSVVHYLGEGFHQSVPQKLRSQMYASALGFISAELERHSASGNEKLQSRYEDLRAYFMQFPAGA